MHEIVDTDYYLEVQHKKIKHSLGIFHNTIQGKK